MVGIFSDETPATFPPTLGSYVADHLMTTILSGEVQTGGRLVEAEISRKLGVSRGPVREALALLERDGLVVSVPRKGKFVVGVDRGILDEVYSLRRLIEPFAVGLLIDGLNERKSTALSGALKEVRKAVSTGNVRDVALADIAFHGQIYKLSDHSLLFQAWTDNIASKLQVLVPLTARSILAHESIHNHESVLAGILARDRREARRLIIAHIDEAWEHAAASLTHTAGRATT